MTSKEPIYLEFAAAPVYVAVARRVAEVVGARAGLAPSSLEELQIAVSEVCNRLVTAAHEEGATHPAICVRFWIEPDRVVAEIGSGAELLRSALAELLDDEFASFLLKRLLDHMERGEATWGLALRLEKLRPVS
jgi:anti-sigma regulatory factor (Ser/Thr protein kinase)